MTNYQRIVQWNEERNLIGKPEELDVTNDMSFIMEEIIEALTPMKSEEARGYARVICNVIRKGNTKEIVKYAKGLSLDKGDDIKVTPEQVVDACCDINVFSTGLIRKQGYNPDIAMDEVLQEIESRVGTRIEGKYTKDKSPEAQTKWYLADFTKAKI